MNDARLALASALLGSTALCGQAFAQVGGGVETIPERRVEETAAAQDTIVVTGSNVRRDSTFQNKQPVQIVGRAKFDVLGADTLEEVLRDLTVNTGSRANDETGGSNGTSQVNIRGLGFGSTLTLINGRRAGFAAISDTSGNDFVDINQFPLSMIERIDVLTDGASAIYGSQAVAGVANIVTRKGFEGFEISGGFRDARNQSGSVSFAAGHGFERGHFNVYGTYYRQSDLFRSEIEFLDERLNGDGNPANGRLVSPTGSPGTYFLAADDGMGGVTRDSSTQFADPDCIAAGGVFRPSDDPGPGGSTAGIFCRVSFFDQVSPVRAEERFQAFAEFDYEIADNLKFINESHFSRNLSTGINGPSFTAGESATGGGWFIPGDHPFNFFVDDGAGGITYAGPDAFAADPTLQAIDLVGVFRPFGAEAAGDNFDDFEALYGTQERRTHFNYFRMTNGLEYEFGNDWYASAFVTYSLNEYLDGDGTAYIEDRLADAVVDGSFNPFGTSTADPNLISPKDGVSTAFNEPLDVATFLSRENNFARSEETVVDFVTSGPLFETGFGLISGAFGAQYRSSDLFFIPDSLTAAGEGNGSGRDFIFEGDQTVWAAFGEVIIPFQDIAELQLAVRHEDYGDPIGSTTDPKISLRVDPTDWLTLRGSYGTSFQAPTIRQTARTVATGFVNDPTSPGVGPQNSVCIDTGRANSIPIITEGNDALGPQSADAFTLGGVIRAGNLQFSADAFFFDYTGVISQGESAQAILLNDCLDDGIANDPRITRDASGGLASITTSFSNVDEVKTNGIDFALQYDIDAGSVGDFVINSQVSLLNKFEINGVDAVGSRNFRNGFGPQPKIRANSGVSWFNGNHSANVTVRYVDSYENDASNDAKIDSYTTVDLQYGLVIPGLISDNDTTFAIGAVNVFDQDPPALRRADASGNIITQADDPIGFIDRPGYDDRAGVSLIGRQFFVRVRQSF